MKNLSTRVAVVTGAANGIGKALAYGLAHEGCRIVLADLPGTELDNTAAAMARSGAECIPVGTDVSCSESVGLLARRTMDRFGEVHVLCNNAGVSLAGRPLIDLMPEDWNWLLGVNLLGAVHGLHHFLPILRDQDEAHVLNTASIGAFRGGTFNGPYCASKAALLSLSESLYRECVADGVPIGVTVLCPGAVHTTIADSDLRRTSKFPGTARHDRSTSVQPPASAKCEPKDDPQHIAQQSRSKPSKKTASSPSTTGTRSWPRRTVMQRQLQVAHHRGETGRCRASDDLFLCGRSGAGLINVGALQLHVCRQHPRGNDRCTPS